MATKATAIFEDDDEVTTPATTAAATTSGDVDTSYDIDLGQAELMTRTGQLEKLTPPEKTAKFVRANLLTDLVAPKLGYTHFIEGKGAFQCLTKRDRAGKVVGEPAICCKKTAGNEKQRAQMQILCLVLHYTNASEKDGSYEKGKPIEYAIKFIKLSQSGYQRVSNLKLEDDGDWTAFDFTISNKGGGKGVGFEYNTISRKPRCRQNPEFWAEVVEQVEPYLDGKILISRFGKKVTPAEFAAAVAGSSAASASDASVDDVEDI